MTAGLEPGMVLAIAPTARGFGFAAFDAERVIMDWGVKEVRGAKQGASLLKARVLLNVLRPDLLVLEQPHDSSSRRSARIRDLIDRLGRFAQDHGIDVRHYARRRVRQVFRGWGAISKDDVAAVVARLLPELGPRLPKRRRIWESEHHAMAIFEAAALALTHFASDG